LDPLGARTVSRTTAANFVGPPLLLPPSWVGCAREVRTRRHPFLGGVRVRKANLAHGAAKAGIDGFGRGLADALADSGVG